MTWQSWFPILGIVPMAIIYGLLILQNRRLDKDVRREAITTELSNLPATSLQKTREEMIDRQLARTVSAMITGMMSVSLVMSRRITGDLSNWGMVDSLAILVLVGSGLYFGYQMIHEMPYGRRLKQAIRAEQAAAQEVASALAGENRLFHDIQCGDFNIDHVVITLAGVFAIETKSRLKPPAGSGSPKVKYDGNSLDFGTWKESKPLEQAERQARWLANYLRKETGEPYAVTAVLSLPGWFVERTARISSNQVQVINPKNARWLLLPENKPAALESPRIRRAATAIEKLARVPEAT